MKTISVIEPWATLLVIGAKRFETRGWKTPYRGWLAIHASKKLPKPCRDYFAGNRWAREAFEAAGLRLDRLPLGCVIGRVYLEDCLKTSDIRASLDERELSFGNFAPRRYAWKVRGAIRHKPVEARGALGLWEWTPPIGFELSEPYSELETMIETNADPEVVYDPQQVMF